MRDVREEVMQLEFLAKLQRILNEGLLEARGQTTKAGEAPGERRET